MSKVAAAPRTSEDTPRPYAASPPSSPNGKIAESKVFGSTSSKGVAPETAMPARAVSEVSSASSETTEEAGAEVRCVDAAAIANPYALTSFLRFLVSSPRSYT